MTVSSIATVAAGVSRPQPTNTTVRAAAVLNSMLSAPKADAVARPTEASALQSQSTQLRQAAQQVAQASTVLSTAQAGITEIARELSRMGELATRAAQSETTDEERSELNTQFQAGRQNIANVVRTTQFNGQPLLQGSAAEAEAFAVDPLTEEVLFPARKTEILTPSGAKISFDAVKVAGQIVGAQQKKIETLQQNVDSVATSVEVASQNYESARSSLSSDDLAALFSGAASSGTAVESSGVQTNRLPSSVLQLLSE